MFEDEMLTIDEVATYLKLKPQTIYKWAQTGKIPGAKYGKEWRFRRSKIKEWIEEQERLSAEKAAEKAAGEKTAVKKTSGKKTTEKAGSGGGGDGTSPAETRSAGDLKSSERRKTSKAARGSGPAKN